MNNPDLNYILQQECNGDSDCISFVKEKCSGLDRVHDNNYLILKEKILECVRDFNNREKE